MAGANDEGAPAPSHLAVIRGTGDDSPRTVEQTLTELVFEAMLEDYRSHICSRNLRSADYAYADQELRYIREFYESPELDVVPWTATPAHLSQWTMRQMNLPGAPAASTMRLKQGTIRRFHEYLVSHRTPFSLDRLPWPLQAPVRMRVPEVDEVGRRSADVEALLGDPHWAVVCQVLFGTHPIQVAYEDFNTAPHKGDEASSGVRRFSVEEMRLFFETARAEYTRRVDQGVKGGKEMARTLAFHVGQYAFGYRETEGCFIKLRHFVPIETSLVWKENQVWTSAIPAFDAALAQYRDRFRAGDNPIFELAKDRIGQIDAAVQSFRPNGDQAECSNCQRFSVVLTTTASGGILCERCVAEAAFLCRCLGFARLLIEKGKGRPRSGGTPRRRECLNWRVRLSVPVLEWYVHVIRPTFPNATTKPWMFLGERGGQMGYDSVRRQFAEVRQLACLEPDLTPHRVRHAFGSHLRDEGVPIEPISESYGHEHPKTTGTYVGTNTDRTKSEMLSHQRRLLSRSIEKQGRPTQ